MGTWPVKTEVRIVGFDDAPFSFGDDETELLGTVFRGGTVFEGMIAGKVKIDGDDATESIIEAVRSSPHAGQLRVIMLDGITFGGFNVADIGKIREETGIPVIAVTTDRPDMEAIGKALSRFDDAKRRMGLMEKAGPPKSVAVKNARTGRDKNIWFQTSGIDEETAREILRRSATMSCVPEPLRVSHLIGKALKGLR